MKTYKTHGACLRNQGSAFPVKAGATMRWASLSALQAMRPIEPETAFACVSNVPEFDRTFTLVCDHSTWGIRTVLARGYEGEWPSIELFGDLAAARKRLAEIVAQYDADGRWMRVVR